MRQICRVLTTIWLGTVAVLAVGVAADAPAKPVEPAAAKSDSPAATPADPAQEALGLSESQDAINARYKRFEKTMNDMVQFLQKTDPDRAAILNRAISRSREDGVGDQMQKLVEVLRDQAELGDAVDRQGEVVTDLQALLDLLMSDDREKELAKEKARIEQYIKDLNKIIAGQKDVRAGTERGESGQSLTPRQEKLAEKTQELGKTIDSDDHERKPTKPADKSPMPNGGEPKDPGTPGESKPGDPKPGDEKSEDSKPGDAKPEDAKPGEAKPEKSKPGESKPGEDSKPGDSKPGDSKPNEGKPGDSKPGESKPGESKPGDSQPGESQPGESQPGESQPGESQPGESQPQDAKPQQTQGRQELEKAKKAMEKAIDKLQKDLQKDASKNQDEALRELQKAKEKLEEILRQLREEERLLQLAGLEARFQRMLAQQIAIYNDTVQIDKVPQGERASRHQLKSEEMALQESELVLEATKALSLMKEEGSAVAFPEAIEQMRYDMQTVAERLKQQDVAQLTQTIELDIIAGLKEMIDAMQQAMDKAKEKQQKPQQQQQQSQEQEEELLKKIAELKMLKSLQLRINSRTLKLGQLYTGEQATQPDVVRQVQELSNRQARIQKATYDLAVGKNK